MNKFRNIQTTVDGIKFASKREAKEYGIQKIRERAGDFHTFSMQVKFVLKVNGIKICDYFADFVTYFEDGKIFEVIDSKGVKTPAYILKKKLMKAIYNIDIIEK